MIDLKPLPMDEAVEFWKDKTPVSPGEFAKLSAAARTRAFAVSGIAKGDELATVYNALGRAIEDGITFDEFKTECREVFERRGWTGDHAWRVKNIYRTNVQTAYQVGRYKQLQTVAETRPYWQYSAINDSRTRPAHRALHGKVFPHDHAFWDTWYPPNGFGCRCSVKSLSERQIQKKGLTVEQHDPTGGPVIPVDPKTGREMPPVSVMPDSGWAYHPGKAAWGGMTAEATAGAVRHSWKTLPDQKGPDAYRRPMLHNVRPAEIPDLDTSRLLPAGMEDEFYAAEFAKHYGTEKVLTDPLGDPVILNQRLYLVSKDAGGGRLKFNKRGHGECIPLIGEMITNPYEIWLTPQQDEATGRHRITRRYVCLWKTPDKERVGGLAIFEVVDCMLQGVSTYLPQKKGNPDLKNLEKQRKGLLLYGKEK